MFLLELSDFVVELEEGTMKHVGASDKTGSAKLFDVDSAGARTFGDERVKAVFEDGTGNAVEVAMTHEAAASLRDDLAALDVESGE